MKIGTISINYYVESPNYGSALQTYALVETLRRLGHDAEVVDYQARFRKGWHFCFPFLSTPDKAKRYKYFSVAFGGLIKWMKFNRFYKRLVPRSTHRYDACNLNLSGYDVVVLGSDTVWNIRQMKGFEPGFFGGFIPPIRCVAYAPSFGDYEYSAEDVRMFQRCLPNISHLSVREPANLEAFGSRKDEVRVVLDPTMLLTKEDYLRIAKPHNIKGKYLLYYPIYSKDEQVSARVDEYARRHELKVVEVSFAVEHGHPRFFNGLYKMLKILNIIDSHNTLFKPNYGALPHIMRYSAGVEEWLGLIAGAEIVVTNSFHGSVFAMLFERPFYNFTRPDASVKIREITKSFCIGHRTLDACTEGIRDDPIDYVRINQILQVRRKESMTYLENAINNS